MRFVESTPRSIEDNLRQRYFELRDEMREKWQRDIPFDELVFDRWERARHLGFGAESSIYHLSYVYGDVKVGEHTWIGPYTLLDGSGGLEIGSWCSISAGVQVYSHDTVDWAVSGGRAEYVRHATVIEDCVYIGANAVVGPGVRIGAHSIVGAMSFVNRPVAPNTIVGGVPATELGWMKVNEDGTVTRMYRGR